MTSTVWQPIKTAPKDGTKFLAFYDSESDPYCLENDEQFGQYEFSFIVLGIGFRLTWVYNPDTDFRREIMKKVKELKIDSDD